MFNEDNLDDFLSKVVTSVLQTASMQYKEDWTSDPEKVSLVIAAFQAYLDTLQGNTQTEATTEENNSVITPEKIAEAQILINRTSFKSFGPYQKAVDLIIDAWEQGLIKREV